MAITENKSLPINASFVELIKTFLHTVDWSQEPKIAQTEI